MGYGKAYCEKAFKTYGMSVVVESACGTGFALSSWAGDRFGKRMESHRLYFESKDEWSPYDGVLIIGGYNDVVQGKQHQHALPLNDAIAETLSECRLFVRS